MPLKEKKTLSLYYQAAHKTRQTARIKTSQAQTYATEVKGCQCRTWNHNLTQMDSGNQPTTRLPPTYSTEDANWITRDGWPIHHGHQKPWLKHPNGHGNPASLLRMSCLGICAEQEVWYDGCWGEINTVKTERECQECIVGRSNAVNKKATH